MFSEIGEKLHHSINEYINALDEEQKVEDLLYQKRLAQCEPCDALQNGVCKYCGCFVVVRAVKKNQKCPYPKSPRW